jgi:hypothetical protein
LQFSVWEENDTGNGSEVNGARMDDQRTARGSRGEIKTSWKREICGRLLAAAALVAFVGEIYKGLGQLPALGAAAVAMIILFLLLFS